MIGAGLSAVVFTDVIQMIVMFTGGFMLLAYGLNDVGGIEGMVSKIKALGPEYSSHLTLYHPATQETQYPWTGILFGLGFVMSTAYFVGNQSIAQRCLGAKSEWDAKASMLLGAFLKALIPIMVVTPGLIALAKFGPTIPKGQADSVYPKLIQSLLPTGMMGLMFAALVSALMSTIDSILNAVSTLFTKDLYQVYIRPEAKDKELLKVGRWVTAVVLILGASTAPMSMRFNGIYSFIQTLMSIVAGPTLAILVLGLFWKRCTQWGGFWGLFLGCLLTYGLSTQPLSSLFFTLEDPFLYVAFWSFIFSLVVAIGVSLFTDAWPSERLKGVMWSSHTDEELPHHSSIQEERSQ